MGHQDVRRERDRSADDVRHGNREGGAPGAVGVGGFEAELETHHEVDVLFGLLLEFGEHRRGGCARDTVVREDFVDLFGFVLGHVDDLALFAEHLGGVMLGFAVRGEIAAQAHGDRACGNFGETSEHHQVRVLERAGESGGQRERDGEAVGQADDDVPDDFAGAGVAFLMLVVRRDGNLHGSIVGSGVRNKIVRVRGAFDTMSKTRIVRGGDRKLPMSWFKRDTHQIVPSEGHEVRTEGLWTKCDECAKVLFKADLDANLQVCPNCGKHFKFDARARIENLLEPGYELVDLELLSTDPLTFVDLKPYKRRLAQARKKTGLNDAIINAIGKMGPHDVVLSVMEYGFIGGSMGSVVGETIARAVDRSLATRHPLIIVAASGGARMMEGIASLMQLAKVSSGLARMDDAKIPYISLMTDPTTGGVTASFAMLGDLNIAEPGALIGFAGPRVIEQTIRQKLPPGFQRSEFLLEHGFLDAIVQRKDLKGYMVQTLGWMGEHSSPGAA